jgi:hypothetical protein
LKLARGRSQADAGSSSSATPSAATRSRRAIGYSRADREATNKTGDARHVVGAHELQFNPLSLMNANKVASASNLGHMDVTRLQGDTGSDESGLSAIL